MLTMLLATPRCNTSKQTVTTTYQGIFTPKFAKQKFVISMTINIRPLHTFRLTPTFVFSSLHAIAVPNVRTTETAVPKATYRSKSVCSLRATSYANQASTAATISDNNAENQEIFIRSKVEGLMQQFSIWQVFVL